MYIDSPQFTRRNVLNIRSNDANSPAKSAYTYQLGLERSMLAQHVTKALNSHQTDFQILQKFRKQAQQARKRRWLSKRAPDVPYQHEKIQRVESMPTTPVKNKLLNPEIPILPVIKEETIISPTPLPLYHPHYIQQRDMLTKQLQKLLNQKDKIIRKKDRKLQKNKYTIDKMQRKIDELKSNKQFQQNELDRVKSLIKEMSTKIAQNQQIFKEQLSKIKYKQNQNQFDLRLLNKYSYSPHSKKLKVYHKNLYDSQKFLNGPSVFYEIQGKSADKAILNNSSTVSKNLSKIYQSRQWLNENVASYEQ